MIAPKMRPPALFCHSVRCSGRTFWIDWFTRRRVAAMNAPPIGVGRPFSSNSSDALGVAGWRRIQSANPAWSAMPSSLK